MRRSATTGRRGAFTLVELLIVIGIIALLAGLLLQVVVKVREAGPRTQTRAEIGQMGLAIENYKATYQVKYLPSVFVLANNYSDLTSPALQDSRQYLSRVWPRLSTPWPGQLALLDGNKCILFFLGGMNRQGWFDSPTNPFQVPSDGSVAKGPFYDFKMERIDQDGHYLDPYGKPYFYFSSRNGNDYDFFGRMYYEKAPDGTLNPDNSRVTGITLEGGYGNAVDQTLSMKPFRGPDGRYLNADGFQIVSAGRDNNWGRGSPCNNWQKRPAPNDAWSKAMCQYANGSPAWTLYEAGIGDYSPGAPGGDDLSNFARGVLGGD